MSRHNVSLIAVLLLLASIRPAGQTTAPAMTAAISGTVKNAATGRPIPAAVVTLLFGSSIQLPPQVSRLRLQMTDALGRFVFRDLPAGTGYRIQTSRGGFVDGRYGQAVAFGPEGAIELAAGQWFDQADVLMWKPSAISGRVVDERGDALVGTFVRVLAQQYVGGQIRLLAGPAAVTDDRGQYRVAGLIPAKYLIVVPSVQNTVPAATPASLLTRGGSTQQAFERELSGFSSPTPRVDAALDLDPANRLIIGNFPIPPPVNGRMHVYPMTFFPGVPQASAATAIEIGLGEERHGVDIPLRAVPAVRISGTVEGPRDQLTNLFLRLMPAGLEQLTNGSEAATTILGADGRFVFLNVPAGSYAIVAARATTELTFEGALSSSRMPLPPGVVETNSQSGEIVAGPPGSSYISRGGSSQDLYWASTSVTAGTEDVSDVVVQLARTTSIAGRMVFEGTARASMVMTSGGRAGGATAVLTAPESLGRFPPIYAEPANADMSLGLPRSDGAVAADGNDVFTIDGLRNGEYVLRLKSGAGRYLIKSITLAGQDVTLKPITTASGRTLGDVVITITDKVPVMTGRVEGDPARVSNAAVIAFPVQRDQWTRYGLTPVRILAVPAAGATGYRIEGLPAGEYFLVAVDRSLITAWQDPKFLERAAGVATRVELAWGQTQPVDLRLTGIR